MEFRNVRIKFTQTLKDNISTTGVINTTYSQERYLRNSIVTIRTDSEMTSEVILDIAEKKLKYEIDDWGISVIDKSIIN